MLGLTPTMLTPHQSRSARVKIAMYSTLCCALLLITVLSVSDCLNPGSQDDTDTTHFLGDDPSASDQTEVTEKAPAVVTEVPTTAPTGTEHGVQQKNVSLSKNTTEQKANTSENNINSHTTVKPSVGVSDIHTSTRQEKSKDNNSSLNKEKSTISGERNAARETASSPQQENRMLEDINAMTRQLAETIRPVAGNPDKTAISSNYPDKNPNTQEPVITNNPKSEINPSDTISVKMLMAKGASITVEDLAQTETRVLLNHAQLRAYSVDYHYKKRLIFYTAFGKILSDEVVARLTRTDLPTTVVNVGAEGPVSLAVDWVHDRLFWMSHRHQTVEVVDLDGANRTLVIDKFRGSSFPNNLAVDPYRRYLFMVVNGSIYRTGLDGKGLREFSTEGVRCLALDRQGQRVLYSGKRGHYTSGKVFIGSCNYDGLECKDLPLEGKWNDIFSLDYFRSTLFFANFNGGEVRDAVWSADISRDPLKPTLLRSSKDIRSVKVYHPEAQAESTSSQH